MSTFFLVPAENELVDLADRIARGDAAAENRLVQLYADRIRLMATCRTRDPEASRELADDVMMAAIGALREGKVRDTGRLGAFVYGTAVNLVNNFLRSRSRRPAMRQLPDDLPALDGMAILERDSDVEYVLRCIEQLGERDRQILQLLFVDGMTPKEVAEQTGLTQEVIRQRKSRALNHLKACLGKPGERDTPKRGWETGA